MRRAKGYRTLGYWERAPPRMRGLPMAVGNDPKEDPLHIFVWTQGGPLFCAPETPCTCAKGQTLGSVHGLVPRAV